MERNGYIIAGRGRQVGSSTECRYITAAVRCLLSIGLLGTVGLAVSCKDRSDPSGSRVRLTGAGATFPKPLYDQWASAYARRRPEVRINYQGIGSGGGVKQLLDGSVEFGATDAPMTDEQLSRGRAQIVHVPTAVGAVVPIYNLPDRK